MADFVTKKDQKWAHSGPYKHTDRLKFLENVYI